MWTRAPSITSCVDCLALDHEEEVGAASPRFHHRGSSSSSNHQPGERELILLQHTQLTAAATALKPESAAALDHFLTLGCESTTLHHDLPKPPGTSKRSLPRGMPFFTETSLEYYPMSTAERASIVAMLRPATGTSSYDVGCVRKDKPQLDDMRTQIIILANAHTPASSDQEVPEVVLPSLSSKRRKLVYSNNETELNRSPAEARSSEGCEDSGLTGEQHMADLDRTSKGSTPEDIDSETAAPVTELLAPVPQQCRTTSPRNQWVLAPEQENVIDPVLPEPLQIFERLHFSSTQLVPGRTSSPRDRDDDSHFTTSQFLPPAGHIRVPDFRVSDTTRTMAGGRDEWLQLSLGGRGQSDDEPLAPVLYQQSSVLNPLRSTTPDPPGIRDFFKFGAETQEASSSIRHDASASPFGPGQSAHSGPHYSGESSKQQHYNPPEPRSAVLSRPLFVEPLPRATSGFDPYVHISRVLPDQLKSSFTPQQFSNLSSSPYHPVRVLQPVRSEQTDTTAVHARRSAAHEAGPSSGPHYNYASSSSAPWMQQLQQQQHRQDTQRTSPNPAEFLTMGTRDWRSGASFSSMQPPMAHGVDPEQAWRNLLQRVGSTTNVPVGASMSSAIPRHPESMPMMPSEYLDALKRAVERFQGADQGGNEEPLAELQRLHRSAVVFPQPRHHSAGLPFDSSPDIGLTRLSTAPGSSKPRAQAAGPGPSSEFRQKRILRPHAPRPGLWFTLLASNSQPEASPLQQIPTAYIRVVDDTMTVAVVRRYLANKLGMASEDEVELTCKGQPLPPSLPLHQVRDGIWQSANTNAPNPNTPQLLSEGKAWKAPDGSITLVGDVVMVITYGRRPQLQQQAPPPTST